MRNFITSFAFLFLITASYTLASNAITISDAKANGCVITGEYLFIPAISLPGVGKCQVFLEKDGNNIHTESECMSSASACEKHTKKLTRRAVNAHDCRSGNVSSSGSGGTNECGTGSSSGAPSSSGSGGAGSSSGLPGPIPE